MRRVRRDPSGLCSSRSCCKSCSSLLSFLSKAKQWQSGLGKETIPLTGYNRLGLDAGWLVLCNRHLIEGGETVGKRAMSEPGVGLLKDLFRRDLVKTIIMSETAGSLKTGGTVECTIEGLRLGIQRAGPSGAG